MLSSEAKDQFARLEMEYAPVAVKFSYFPPEGIRHEEQQKPFCEFIKDVQDSGDAFFVTADNDVCCGKVTLGMVPKPPVEASGQMGYEIGVFKTPAANARLHNTYPVLAADSVRYVTFAPLATCNFDPDLVYCVADTDQADILMRATSYISGDLWESVGSHVMSCAWMFTYPYVTGKVNFLITGMHHGQKMNKHYPKGMHHIVIPYQKLDEVVKALGEMDWVTIAFREDEESKAELQARMDRLEASR